MSRPLSNHNKIFTETKCGIYKILNIVNGKLYIGSAVDIRKRWNWHRCKLRGGVHSNKHLQRSFNKYGKDSFEFSILEECAENMLIIREDAWINYYDSMNQDKGYNLTPADRHIRRKGFKHTEECRKRMSKSHKGVKLGEEHRKNLALSHPKEYDAEFCKKVSEGKKGKKFSEEHKLALSNARKLYYIKIRQEKLNVTPKEL